MAATPTAVRAFEYHLVAYRRTWRGGVVTTFLNPVMFLAAMGLGLGSFVDEGGADTLGGVPYLEFLAPGLLAATCMQVATGEATYPVMAGIKWIRTYHAMLATPLGVRDVLRGHLGFIASRLATTAAAFTIVMLLFGAAHSSAVVLGVPAGVLTGMAFATPIFAFSAHSESDTAFASLFRFVVVPMFLFSGTFFPVEQLPALLEPVAYVTPLWHGVALCRHLSLGSGTPLGDLGHAAYLVAWFAAGYALAHRALRRRLVT
jgi:lipooligosaccharide transport system permease protein